MNQEAEVYLRIVGGALWFLHIPCVKESKAYVCTYKCLLGDCVIVIFPSGD